MYNSLETRRTVAVLAFFMKPTLIVVVCSSTHGLKPRIVSGIIAARNHTEGLRNHTEGLEHCSLRGVIPRCLVSSGSSLSGMFVAV